MDSELLDKVKAYFTATFQTDPVMFRAPGRINIIGEHIDYNDGFVLPMAIDKSIVVAIARNNTPALCRVHAIDLDESREWSIETPLADRPVWLNYIYGSLDTWYQQGYAVGGLDLAFSGNIPLGSGMSSSAALEASMASAIAHCWSVSLTKKELALHCQKLEQDYVGVQCGIMDQYASVFGNEDEAILLDCREISHQFIPCQLGTYSFLLCNSGVSHSLASSQYNVRRKSCEAGLEIIKDIFPETLGWRDINLSKLQTCQNELDPITYRRCLHVVREIGRVQDAAQALESGELNKLGALMYQSHYDLSINYEVSCPEVDFLVELAKKEKSILGARMMGGGFGGCTINLIATDAIPVFVEKATMAYLQKYGITLECYAVKGGRGAERILP